MTTKMHPQITDLARERAQEIAELVEVISRQKAKDASPYDWASERSFRDYVVTLGSVEGHVEETDDGKLAVVAVPRMHPHGGYWTNVPSEVLDAASGRNDQDREDEFTFRFGEIVQAEGSYEARLVIPGRLPCDDCGADPDEECTYGCASNWA
jgi:hypothetical protein